VSRAYTTLWSRDRVEAAVRQAGPAFRFETLFGGPHVSLPSFRRAGVVAGDWVYPVAVRAGALHVLGRMRVARLVSIDEFRALEVEQAAKVGPFDLAVRIGRRPDERVLWNTFLAPTCVDEVLLGTEGSPLLPNLTAPPEVVRDLRFTSRRGERPIKHVSPEGRITAIASLQGVYRLSDASAQQLAAVVGQALSPDTPG
jgi:hypothetical protein